MNYRIQCFGWEVEFIAHSLTNNQVLQILEVLEDNEYSELWEARFQFESEGIISDIYDGDLFHFSKALDNDTMRYVVIDENNIEILSFLISEMSDIYEILGDSVDDISYDGYLAIPELINDVDNLLFIADESKGGLYEMLFESDEVPTPKDFCYFPGDVGTPAGDWDFISKIFYKGKELEIYDYLDSRGKASTFQIFTKDGKTIS
tara:strand:+ start:11829 stop:12443 length:615 start_codon:yes stop_codon:yes gene_type:complete